MPQVFKRRWTWRGQQKVSRWYYLDYYIAGKRIIQRTDPKTEKYREALLQLRRAVGRIADGWTPATKKVPTVGQVIGDYLIYLEGHAPSSMGSRACWLRWWMAEYGTLSTGEFDQAEVDAAVLRLKVGHKPSTVAGYLSSLRSAFNRWDRNHPVSHYKIKDKGDPRRIVWTQEEVDRACAASPPWLAGIIRLGVLSGLRIGDMLALTWENIDFKRCTFTIRQGKTGVEISLPLTTAAIQHLESLGPGTGLVFSLDGERISYFKAHHTLRDICDPISIKKNLHDLRRTFAQRMRDAGADDRAIAGSLGQKTSYMAAVYSWDEVERLRTIMEASQKQALAGAAK